MARVERGEATHLSVLALVKDHLGKEVIAQFHIDHQALIKSSLNPARLYNDNPESDASKKHM